jgi:heme oxygenase (biliverdin-producing, ferredoxin)
VEISALILLVGTALSSFAAMDYSQPISFLLKMGTSDVHEASHRSEGAVQLIDGRLTVEQYILYLQMLHRVYR